ncbi:MAG: S-methyl-5-thioribose-1-phosphate isomerase [Firmicutes bacterium]|nr:S-methyl-5-thioribose-1-phosphate isomerase [Bacillota bacterium]
MKALEWTGDCLKLLDQTKLPLKTEFVSCQDYITVAEAIRTMQVRGAPAIGVAAAFGLVLAAKQYTGQNQSELVALVEQAADTLRRTRPTAVNLFWAIERMLARLETEKQAPVDEIKAGLEAEAKAILAEDIAMNRRIGELGSQLVPVQARILTHCNAGALATGGYGTALGVIRSAHQVGKVAEVYADETRPLLQGARLTVWELLQDQIPVTLIADNMAGYLMQQGKVDLVIVGADRIAANGDVANKIGTYSLAVLAHAHGIPFYVAAPASTLDLSLSTGANIPIEERHPEEVRHVFGQRIAPVDVKVYNPAFDVTPNRLITAIITDRGIARPPYEQSLAELVAVERGGQSG